MSYVLLCTTFHRSISKNRPVRFGSTFHLSSSSFLLERKGRKMNWWRRNNAKVQSKKNRSNMYFLRAVVSKLFCILNTRETLKHFIGTIVYFSQQLKFVTIKLILLLLLLLNPVLLLSLYNMFHWYSTSMFLTIVPISLYYCCADIGCPKTLWW